MTIRFVTRGTPSTQRLGPVLGLLFVCALGVAFPSHSRVAAADEELVEIAR